MLVLRGWLQGFRTFVHTLRAKWSTRTCTDDKLEFCRPDSGSFYAESQQLKKVLDGLKTRLCNFKVHIDRELHLPGCMLGL